jgi:hypothetical protein
MGGITKFFVESVALSRLLSIGYTLIIGPDIAPGELVDEHDSFQEALLAHHVHDVLHRLNLAISADVLEI